LEHQANHDALTGIFNRRAFEVHLQEVLVSLRSGGQERCLLYIDLDQFKLVNDTCGHSAGDKLLQEITAIMQRTMSGNFFARLGGDEFGLILEGDEELGCRQANKLIDAIHAHQYEYSDHHFRLGASVGMVTIKDASRSIDELLIAADQACYAAKDRGRNRIEIYRDSDEYFRTQRAQFLSVEEINYALREQGFVLYHQRIVPLDKQLSEHSEILLRMVDRQGNIHNPDRFIPAAERFNLMPDIDRWVIRNACQHLNETHLKNRSIAINLSGLSISHDDLADYVVRQFNENNIDPCRISFEITETAAIACLDKAQSFIRTMHELGVKVALDDFGTGLSSFAYLRKLEVDFLKIDALFIRDMDNDERNLAVVRSIVEVAKVYGMQTIAEFVHSQKILKLLEQVGVDYVQGYAIHKPESFS
jgi:diguanylate cyclase (GGDEF)-like protein